MRIKKIELIGFKSFKDRTVIHFDAGITGIVGPNGCGKSNIVDALIWVMGEMSAKDLRGATMSDVIFAGAESYAPSGMAEVSLTLENDGGAFPVQYARHTEVMVTRRLHRSGESEYLINKEPARLKDVQEIFMDTGAGSKGFSIVAQGMIGRIITAKPEDRRMLIEEAAGITKFKARKRESIRKIQATEQNLLRLQDIIGELKRQMDSLERQAQRAERYRGLKAQVEELDLWVSSLQFKDLRATSEESQTILQNLQMSEAEIEAEISHLASQLESARLEVLETEKSVSQLQSQQMDMQGHVQKQELEIQSLKFEIEQARRNEQMTDTLLQEQRARREILSRDFDRMTEQQIEVQEVATTTADEFKIKQEAFSVLQKQITSADDELTDKRRELFAYGQSLSSIEAKLGGLQSQIGDLRSRESHEFQLLQELAEKRGEYEERRTRIQTDYDRERQLQLDLASDVESFEANKKILTEQIVGKKTEVDEFKDKLNETASRLYGLENLQQNFEGFADGVKNVMLWQKAQQAEVHADGSFSFRPVSEVVEVPAEYEIAMEAALGSRLQVLLSASSQATLAAVDHLKTRKAGRSSFLTGLGEREGSATVAAPTGDGVVALLKDVVSCNEDHRAVVSELLGSVAVVDSLSRALELRPGYSGWSFVTRDGDVLSADGVLTGGAAESADTGMLKRRREIKELTAEKNEWAGKLALAQASLKKLELQLETVTQDFEGARQRRIEQEIRVTEFRKDLERAETELENVRQAYTRQERTLAQLGDQIKTAQARLEEIESAQTEAAAKKHEAESRSQELEAMLSEAKQGYEGRQAEVIDLQMRSATKAQELQSLLRQIEMIQKQVHDLDTQLGRITEESERNSSFATENMLLLEEKKVAFERGVTLLEETRQKLAQQRDLFERQGATAREFEEKYSVSQRGRSERQTKMSEAQLKLEQARMKEQYLTDQVREKYMLELAQIYETKLDREGDPKAAEQEIKELREKIAKIGEVNLSAISEFDETSQRYKFLSQQQEDLIESKAQLQRVIERINRICSRRFKETFDLVNERFTKVFPVLFGGGEANLQMIEDVEKGEQGIEIIARPPGKKMQNISLLSGGEKALTAVSLIFAIFLVKPSPYCLLDEVDAPLDDANVFRFNDLVREMAKRSQIIVVTHNKHTMEVASKLYGVTMQERGVSTMVSVDLSQFKA